MSHSAARREEAEAREREVLGTLACFSDTHFARPLDERPDRFRTCFVRDRDRVIHCGAFRRLKDKTQVFVIDEGDFYRTRLTHTLEVSQMARFLCRALRLNESLGEVLALVHDIGHPPFGHEGERMLGECVDVPFDHNRQALRIVDVLESPYTDRPGLNLTHVVRHSILKHGGSAGHGAADWAGHVVEAQVADLADSTAYQHHDLEDGLRAGILTGDALAELGIWKLAASRVDAARAGPGTSRADRVRRRMILSQVLKTALVDLVDTTSDALGAVSETSSAALAGAPRRVVRHSSGLAALHGELAGFLHEHFYRHPRVLRSVAMARDAIGVIAEHYRDNPRELPETYLTRVDEDGLDRSVCDYVAGMTDRFAMDEWRRLAAQRPVTTVSERTDMTADTETLVLNIETLQHRVGHVFRDRKLAETALTHSSARSDDQHPNERMEFLGDSVLGMLVADELFARFPDHNEGDLSRIKSSVVNRHALRKVARRWRLDELLTLGPGFRDASDIPPSVVADAVEAVLGAVYLDAGVEVARRVVRDEFGPLIDLASDRSRASNFKSTLQNFTQGELGFTPHYQVLDESGPDHAKTFSVAAIVNGRRVAVANGRNKRQAEQRAAREALTTLVAEHEAEKTTKKTRGARGSRGDHGAPDDVAPV